MDFAKTTLFVGLTGNTLPSTGSTQNLTAGQIGVFINDAYTASTAGNIAAANYITIAQGRDAASTPVGLGSKKSDKIYDRKVVRLWKTTGSATRDNQITTITGINAKCGEDLVVTLRLFSSYINAVYFNGLTRSVIVQTPCCDCGDDICADVSAADIAADIVAQINAEPMLSQFVTATVTGEGDDEVTITGKAPTEYSNNCVLPAFPYEYDAIRFFAYATRGPETTQDFEVFDACDVFATVTTTQIATYPMGTPDQIRQLEKNYFSYQTTMKDIYWNPLYNGAFNSFVSDSVAAYSLLYIDFFDSETYEYEDASKQTSRVIIALPPTEAAAMETRLELYFSQDFEDKTGA